MRWLGWLLIWFAYAVPPTVLIVVGAAEIIAGYVPALEDRIGHAPLPLSIGMIVFGCLGAAPSLYLAHLLQRRRRLIASRKAHA